MIKYCLSFAMIIAGFKVLFVKKFWSQGIYHDFSNPFFYIPISGFLIIGGTMLLFAKSSKILSNNHKKYILEPKEKKFKKSKRQKNKKPKFDEPKNELNFDNVKFKNKKNNKDDDE